MDTVLAVEVVVLAKIQTCLAELSGLGMTETEESVWGPNNWKDELTTSRDAKSAREAGLGVEAGFWCWTF